MAELRPPRAAPPSDAVDVEATAAAATRAAPKMDLLPVVGSSASISPSPSPDDNDRLASLGYEPQLRRNLGVLAIGGLGAAIIAAPFGLTTAAPYALQNGGSPSYVWGWLLMSAVSLCLAASLGEIASAYPSAGGVYVWTAYLAPRKWSALASYTVGWISVVVTLCLSIAFGEAQLILAAVSVFRDQQWTPAAWQTVLTFWAVMVFCAALNAYGVRLRLLEPLNRASIYWTLSTSVVVLVAVLSLSEDRRSAREVFVEFQNAAGWPDGWAFFIGLLSSAYTLTGYGTIAQMSEEVVHPEVALPRGMVGCVVAASLTGFAFVLPMSFVFPADLGTLLSAASGPLPQAFVVATGSAAGGFGLLFLILGVGLFASVGSLTVALRAVWAFSRDGGIPGSRWWKQYDEFHQLPLNALVLSTVVISLLGLIYLGASSAFNAFTGAATILLAVSYILPIALSMASRRRAVRRHAAWRIPTPWLGWLANTVALAWVVFSIPLFCFPTNVGAGALTPSTMNYASAVVVFFASVALGFFAAWARRGYTGPLGLERGGDAGAGSGGGAGWGGEGEAEETAGEKGTAADLAAVGAGGNVAGKAEVTLTELDGGGDAGGGGGGGGGMGGGGRGASRGRVGAPTTP